MTRSSFRARKKWADRVPAAPSPTTTLGKFTNAVPLPFHLLLTGFNLWRASLSALVVHVIDGPIKSSWSLTTSVLHSMLKCLLESHPPQGRHAMDVVRFATQWPIPAFLFNSTFSGASISISSSDRLQDAVVAALGITGKLNYLSSETSRYIYGEWSNHETEHNDSQTAILYLHGGAHIFMNPTTHRSLTSTLAHRTKRPVFSPDYRLCPENPFPAAIVDALACYMAMIGYEPKLNGSSTRWAQPNHMNRSFKNVFLVGDSSGACLILQLMQTLKLLDIPLPVGAVLLSPFLDHGIVKVDVEMKSASWHVNWNADFLALDMKGVEWAMQIYANGLSPGHPVVSPVHSDLWGLPPILVQSGDSEVVTDDAVLFSENAREAGTHVQLELYKDMFHVFHLFSHLNESTEAVNRIVFFITETLDELECDSNVTLSSENAAFSKQYSLKNQSTLISLDGIVAKETVFVKPN